MMTWLSLLLTFSSVGRTQASSNAPDDDPSSRLTIAEHASAGTAYTFQGIEGHLMVASEDAWRARQPRRFLQEDEGLVTVFPEGEQEKWCTEESSTAPATFSPLMVTTGPSDIAWRSDYENGRRLAILGLKSGLIGGTATLVGLPLVIVGFVDASAPLLVGSAVLIVGGSAMALVGAPLAAYGVSKSYRALSSAELVNGTCVGCIAGWTTIGATAVLPYALSGGAAGVITLGSSFIISAVQLRQNHQRYTQGTQARLMRPMVRVAPVMYRDGRGLALHGVF